MRGNKVTQTRGLSPAEQAFRALCLGIAAMVIVPLVVYVLALQVVSASGSCELPVLCSFAANRIALHAALPGLLAGITLSVLLDWRRTKMPR
jgi:hypothetical protein